MSLHSLQNKIQTCFCVSRQFYLVQAVSDEWEERRHKEKMEYLHEIELKIDAAIGPERILGGLNRQRQNSTLITSFTRPTQK